MLVSLRQKVKEYVLKRKEAFALGGAVLGLLISFQILIASSQKIHAGSLMKNIGMAIFSFVLKHFFQFENI
ncbi:MAG TPA: hypothetical protein PK014_05635 [Thermoanaerobaculia bacterium]|nr:hypothetical protein [Thermoanaerobaculia bacterium]HUM28694.1 hypothetical protein [Thermoanaerobaculia bacterium]HXK68057.1 hypothetical protein [Thermoanaerobaculia bacterium]